MRSTGNGQVTGILSFFAGRAVDKRFLAAVAHPVCTEGEDLFQDRVFTLDTGWFFGKRKMTNQHADRLNRNVFWKIQPDIPESFIIILFQQIVPVLQRPELLIITAAPHLPAYLSAFVQLLPAIDDHTVPFPAGCRYPEGSGPFLAKIEKQPFTLFLLKHRLCLPDGYSGKRRTAKGIIHLLFG